MYCINNLICIVKQKMRLQRKHLSDEQKKKKSTIGGVDGWPLNGVLIKQRVPPKDFVKPETDTTNPLILFSAYVSVR